MKNKKIFYCCAAAVIIIAVILVECLTPGMIWLFTPQAKAKDGVLPGADQIESVPEGEIRFQLNDNVIFENDYKKGSFMFANPESCEYSLEFAVYEIIGDGETENLIYSSPRLQPGQYISEDKLPKKTEKGKYNCIYYARAYKDGEYCGERHGKMTVTVFD